MATYQDKIRTKLDNKIFSKLGKTVTLISYTSPTYNIRGEQESIISSTSAITIVPYNIITKEQTHQAFGDLQEGSMDAAVRYTVNLNIDDGMTIDGISYLVKAIDYNYLPDNVVTIIRLAKLGA